MKDVHCVGTTKGCSLNSPPPDRSAPAGDLTGCEGHASSLSLSLWGWGVEGAFGGSTSSPAAACQVLTQRQADEGPDAKRKASFLHAVSRLKSGVFLRFWVICNHLPPEFSWIAGHKEKPGDKTQ